MASGPSSSSTLSSRDLCQRAIRAYERLYRLFGCDDPDLAANVTFTAGRIRLLRLAAAAPWSITAPAGDDVLTLIETAERTSDPVAAERLFSTFAEDVWRRLERRRPQAAGPFADLSRRAADRLRQASHIRVEAEEPRNRRAPVRQEVESVQR